MKKSRFTHRTDHRIHQAGRSRMAVAELGALTLWG
jgi:hypothetical protein